MKNKKTIKLLVLLLVATTLSGCLNDLFEQEDQTYQDDPKLEFRPQNDTYSENEGEVEVLVQLIGPQRDSDLSVEFSVNQDTTTAESGVHYEIMTSSPVVIPANSSSAAITIQLDGTSLNEDEIRILGLTLEEGGEVEPAENLKNYVMTIEGVD